MLCSSSGGRPLISYQDYHMFLLTLAGLLTLFFWLYTMSYVAYGYFIHVFFDKAMTGGIVGMVVFFAMFLVGYILITPDTSGPPRHY